MHDGFDVFKTYLGIKLHFTTDYDYIDYGGKVNCKLETFTKRNDRYFFHKLSKQYDKYEIVDFFVSNFLDNDKQWVGNLLQKDGKQVYLNYKKYKDGISYHFRNDMLLVSNDFASRSIRFDDGLGSNDGQHPRLLRLYIQKKISHQSMVILDYHLNFIKQWDKQITEKFVWPVLSKRLKKYRKFAKFNETETKLTLKDVFVR